MKHRTRTMITAASLLVAFALVACDGCQGDAYKRIAMSYRVVNASAQLAEDFDRALKTWATEQNDRCLKSTAPKSPEYAACIKPALDLLRAWTGEENGKPTGKGALPAIQSAQRAARLALNAAFDYLQEKDKAAKCETDECKAKINAWQALIRPGVCALVEIVDRAIKLGAYKVTDDPIYRVVKTFSDSACSK